MDEKRTMKDVAQATHERIRNATDAVRHEGNRAAEVPHRLYALRYLNWEDLLKLAPTFGIRPDDMGNVNMSKADLAKAIYEAEERLKETDRRTRFGDDEFAVEQSEFSPGIYRIHWRKGVRAKEVGAVYEDHFRTKWFASIVSRLPIKIDNSFLSNVRSIDRIIQE